MSGRLRAVRADLTTDRLGGSYDVVWSYLVPLAIPLLLLRADLRRILREAGPTLLAFAVGAAAAWVTAEAVRDAVRSAEPVRGVPTAEMRLAGR